VKLLNEKREDLRQRRLAGLELSADERKEVEQRTAPPAVVIHEAIREEGERELRRPVTALAWSGLAAGLSMGFSLVAQGLLQAYLPNAAWRPLVTNLGYSVGFLIVVLGRQQLFTENTLTAILPLLVRRDVATLLCVLRLWLIVLIANLVGAAGFAWVVGHTAIFAPDVRQAFTAIGTKAMSGDFWTILVRAVFAGWLIALMVWLLPGAEATRLHVIIIITFLVGLGSFAHIIAGSVETLYVVETGATSWGAYFGGFMAPTLVGNVLGGISMVAVLNHAQVITETKQRQAESEQ
jgi:formate/nitrite transporter FocA (FNT family)